MRIKSKREGFFAIVLIICMLVTGKPVIASEDSQQKDYMYYFNGNGIVITGYSGTDANVIIPEEIDGKPVTVLEGATFAYNNYLESVVIPKSVSSIHEFAFAYCPLLNSIKVEPKNSEFVSVDGVLYNKNQTVLIRYPENKPDAELTLPQSITSIGNLAFISCTRLETIKIPESVTSIGYSAFDGCSTLKSINLPSKLEVISNLTFSNCISLSGITIPESVTSIEDAAFQSCWKLKTISFSKNVKKLGRNVFLDCTILDTINVDANNTYFISEKGILFNKNKTELWRYPQGKTDSVYNIPESVTSIVDGAFYLNAYISEIVIPDGIKSIGDYVFFGCEKLTDVNVPDSITIINEGTFSGCTSLDEINLSNNITTL